LKLFEECFKYCPTVEHLHAYCRGLLSDLPRKSAEPIALACGTAVRTLQEFLRNHVWDGTERQNRASFEREQRASGERGRGAACAARTRAQLGTQVTARRQGWPGVVA
jgi:hypothetical protein